MNLVIVESPTKAKTLTKFLGSDYQIQASMGHVRDLPKSVLGINLEKNFKPEYVMVVGREQTIETLRQAAKKAKQVILATDPDREGEAIAYHVAHVLREDQKAKAKSEFSRIVFHEITKEAIEEALAHPGKINMHLVDAQQGRRVLDRLVGYKLSPLLWKKVRRGLSAGRVQSVAVRLVVEREAEIEAFKAEEYWEIGVVVKAKAGGFTVQLTKIGEEKAEVGNQKKADEVVADLNQATYTVSLVKRQEVHQSPPPPYMTSTLQRAAANGMGWTSKKTMQMAQKLYEKGLITYHRTDSLNIAAQALKQVAAYIKKTYGENYALEKPRFFKKQSRLAQEAHEAIRPTSVSDGGKISSTKMDEERLYQMIWRRFVASQMAVAVFDRTTIEVKAQATRNKKQEKIYSLRAVGRMIKFAGWLTVYGGDQKSKLMAQDSEEQKLPEVAEGEKLKKDKVLATQKFTEPPPRFNEASLIKALEERGIGRPSTYAPIISTIQARQYVEKKEQRFYPTTVGEAVTKFLKKYFPDIMDYEFTAGMEDSLDKVASGEKDWEQVIKAFYGPFAKDLKQVEKKAKRVKVEVEATGDKCPECKKGDVVIRLGRFGKFLSCSTFPKCRYTAAYIEKIEGVKCPDDGGEIVVRRTKTGRHFYGCGNYPKCKWASWRKPK